MRTFTLAVFAFLSLAVILSPVEDGGATATAERTIVPAGPDGIVVAQLNPCPRGNCPG